MCVSFLLNRESSVCRGNSNRGYSPLTFWSWLVCAFVRRVNLERKKKKGRSLSNEKQERIHNQMLAPKSCCGTWWIEPVHLYSVSGSVCNTRLKINHSFFLSSFHYWHCTGQIQKRVTAKVKMNLFLVCRAHRHQTVRNGNVLVFAALLSDCFMQDRDETRLNILAHVYCNSVYILHIYTRNKSPVWLTSRILAKTCCYYARWN